MLKFEKAATLFERGVKRNPEDPPTLLFLTATYSHLGREQDAQVAIAKLREISPNLLRFRFIAPYSKFKDPKDLNLFTEGLAKAVAILKEVAIFEPAGDMFWP